GLPTVLPFHRAVVVSPAFTAPDHLGVHTGWIQADFDQELPSDPQFNPVAPEAPRHTFSIEVDGRRMALGLPAALLEGLLRGLGGAPGAGLGAGLGAGSGAGGSASGSPADAATAADGLAAGPASAPAPATAADPDTLRASMGGSVVKWLIESGALVTAGDPVLVLEAMKMESIVVAHRSGTLRDQLVQPGDPVAVDSAVASIGD
ncbi:MAG TPA: biotin/lipoyl-containing protein, partial [Cryobacterium sp.]|nr:biotin/lipoyl-containing protein [Cryobacterium sp.]